MDWFWPFADTKEPVTLEAYRIKLEVFSAEAVTLMGRQLIEHYLLLSQEDLHLWETNPEEFGMCCTNETDEKIF